MRKKTRGLFQVIKSMLNIFFFCNGTYFGSNIPVMFSRVAQRHFLTAPSVCHGPNCPPPPGGAENGSDCHVTANVGWSDSPTPVGLEGHN
jgi:hypothetical protein